MHPLSHKPYEETLPIACYCAKYRKKFDDRNEKEMRNEEKKKQVSELDQHLKAMIKKYRGRYYGTSYLYDA